MPTIINGTTGVDQIQPGAVLQADLAANVTGNGPCFSAYQSVAQTIPATVATKIQYQSEEFDVGSAFDNGTNSRFQPSVAGYYQINVNYRPPTFNGNNILSLYKNGSLERYMFQAVSSVVQYSGSALCYLNGTTDYLEVWASDSAGGTLNNTKANSFSGFLARSA